MLGNNRDYTTSARQADRAVRKHNELMKKYEEEGMSRDEASKKAYKEVVAMGITGIKSKQICINGKMV